MTERGTTEPMQPATTEPAMPHIVEFAMNSAAKHPTPQPHEVARRIRAMKLEKYSEKNLGAELRVVSAEYSAHIAQMEYRFARLRRTLASLISAFALLVVFAAMEWRLRGEGRSAMLFLVGPVGAAMAIVYYFSAKSRIRSQAMLDVVTLQIVAAMVQEELTRRTLRPAEKSSG